MHIDNTSEQYQTVSQLSTVKYLLDDYLEVILKVNILQRLKVPFLMIVPRQ